MQKLILFDIDGTLVVLSSGIIDAFAVAFKAVFNVYASILMIEYHGMTDQQIITNVLLHVGVDKSEIDAKMSECMTVMCDYFTTVKDSVVVELLPGVKETVAALDGRGYLLGLVTGNLEPIAHGKLSNAGIDQYFKLGGFGSDCSERPDLVKIALKKAANQFNFTVDNNVFLFGDTPDDIRAARDAGVVSVGVATGVFTKKELIASGANQTLNNLQNMQAVEAAIKNRQR